MTRIANDANITKKALDKEFGSKGHLVEECMKRKITEIETEISTVVAQAQSSLERLFITLSVVIAELSWFCAAYYKDLKEYPVAQNRLYSFKENFCKQCTEYFRECEKEGFFPSELNMESVASICVEQLSSLEYKYQASIIRLYLKSICTEKGNEELHRIDSECGLFNL
jgi:hypothetical protein